MTKTNLITKIDFRPFALDDKSIYEDYFAREQRITGESERGCEFSFANLYLWGRQNFALQNDNIVLFSQFGKRCAYPYPVGAGDKKTVIDSIIKDADARGIPCRITGLTASAKQTLEGLYPDKFEFHSDEGSFDYVYSIDDLADLSGKKYDGKRNHLRRFADAHPHCTAVPITDDNISRVKQFANDWYSARLAENPDADFHMERAALEKALRDYKELSMEGIVLFDGDTALAFTLASRMSDDTFDVHFEKARSDIQGAYAAINREFARYIRNKYPAVLYLDREEDMGIEGLRRAKRSYHPHHMIKKWWACLI